MSCRYSSTGRTGLYVMVFIILVNTCSGGGGTADEVHRRLDRIEERLELCLSEPEEAK